MDDIKITMRLMSICLIIWGMWKTIPDAIYNYTGVQATLIVCAWSLMLSIALTPFVLQLLQKFFNH